MRRSALQVVRSTHATDWSGSSAVRSTENAAYDGVRARVLEQRKARQATPGDPVASAAAVLAVVDAEQVAARLGDRPGVSPG